METETEFTYFEIIEEGKRHQIFTSTPEDDSLQVSFSFLLKELKRSLAIQPSSDEFSSNQATKRSTSVSDISLMTLIAFSMARFENPISLS